MLQKGLLAVLLLLAAAAPCRATDLVDVLRKHFKEQVFPFRERVVEIRVRTPVRYLDGNRRRDDALCTLAVHERLLRVLGRNGWRPVEDREPMPEPLDGGVLEMEVGEGADLRLRRTLRIKTFLHMCERPLRKYRGGDLDAYFQRVVERAEECLTYDYRLQCPGCR